MKKIFVIAIAAAVAVTGFAETTPQAAAAETAPVRSIDQVRDNALAQMNAGELVDVQKRGRAGRSFRGGRSARGGRGFRGGRSFGGGRSFRGNRYSYRRGGYGGRRYYRGGRRGYGGALVAGVAGLAVGAAIANSGRSYGGGSQSCAERFKSYNPRTGTYLGYDGRRHACP